MGEGEGADVGKEEAAVNGVFGFLAMLLALFVPMGEDDPFEFGSRPPDHVFDGTGVVDRETAGELAEMLKGMRDSDGIDVIVVVLADLEGAPPNYVANRFAEEWCDTAIHAVVLHVPGHPDTPWIRPAGRLTEFLQPDRVERRVEEARRRASLEPDDSGVVRAAVVEATDMLRYWKGTAINRSEALETARTKMKLELEEAAWRRKVLMVASAASAIPLMAGVSVLVSRLRRKGTLYFPELGRARRLGAPHAGGNRMVVALGKDRGDKGA